MIAHELGYVAQASPHDPRDLVRKSAKALDTPGATFINVLAPCPRGWRADGAETIDLAREAVETCYWPLFGVINSQYRLTYRPHHKKPLIPSAQAPRPLRPPVQARQRESLRPTSRPRWTTEWESPCASAGSPARPSGRSTCHPTVSSCADQRCAFGAPLARRHLRPLDSQAATGRTADEEAAEPQGAPAPPVRSKGRRRPPVRRKTACRSYTQKHREHAHKAQNLGVCKIYGVDMQAGTVNTFPAAALVHQLHPRQLVELAHREDPRPPVRAEERHRVERRGRVGAHPVGVDNRLRGAGTPALTAMSRITIASLNPLSPTPPRTRMRFREVVLVELGDHGHSVADRRQGPARVVHLGAEDDGHLGRPPVVRLAEEEERGDREEGEAGPQR